MWSFPESSDHKVTGNIDILSQYPNELESSQEDPYLRADNICVLPRLNLNWPRMICKNWVLWGDAIVCVTMYRIRGKIQKVITLDNKECGRNFNTLRNYSINIQGVSGGIVNILGAGSIDELQ